MTDILTQLRTGLVDRYQIERELGRGGMATVYLAHDIKHDRLVAVKVLDPDLAATVGPDRFLREIRLAAGLQHPHIMAVYDSGEAEGLLYFVMPFVEGESLRDKLNREQQLSIEEAVQLAREVADALAFAHSRGIVHRDIKPENILLYGGHAVVADFGIARAVSEAGDKLTQTGMAIGTPSYMSPEQASGEHSVDGRSDVYSLACVLYEMLSGQPPFVGPSARAIMAKHSMEIVPSLQILRGSIPDELEDTIFRALEKVPADRFATAVQFGKALGFAESTAANHRVSRIRTRQTGQHLHRHVTGGWQRYRWGALALVPVLAGAGWLISSRLAAKTPAAGAVDETLRSIAVMYFEDRSGGDSLRHVADGMTDALIDDLSSIRSLNVVSRNGILPYKGSAVRPDSLAKALGVGMLVDGSVTAMGDNIRVGVSLINATTGKLIASKTLTRPRADLFALQDDLANEVSIFLRQRLGQEMQLQERKAQTRSTQAWEAVERAKETADGAATLLAAGDPSAASRELMRADTTLGEAEALDREWVTPVVLRGWLAYNQARTGKWDREAMAGWLSQSTAHADRALQMDASNTEARELSGTVRYFTWLIHLEPDATRAEALHQRATQDLRAATAADANRAVAWSTLSHLLLGQSETAEAKLAALKAYEADPYLTSANLIVWRLFVASWELGDKVESAHWCTVGGRRFPEDPRFSECRLMNFAFGAERKDIPEAWRSQTQMAALTSEAQREISGKRGRMQVAIALAEAGLADSARTVARQARAGADVDPTRDLALWEAIIHTVLGDRNEALRNLGLYLATNPQTRAAMARDESWYFRDLHSEPRYREMLGATQ